MATDGWDGIAPLQASYYPFLNDFNESDLILAQLHSPRNFFRVMRQMTSIAARHPLELKPLIRALCVSVVVVPSAIWF